MKFAALAESELLFLCVCAIPASFAPICFAIKAKENDMLPLEKNRVRLDDDSDEDKVFILDHLLHAHIWECILWCESPNKLWLFNWSFWRSKD